MVPKLNPVMSLNRGNSNQVNPNEVTTVKRQKAGDKIFVNRLIKKKKKKKISLIFKTMLDDLAKQKSLRMVKCYQPKSN